MQIIHDHLVLRKEDYDLVMAYLRGQFGKTLFDRHNAEAMQSELRKARLVSREDFPSKAIGVNTKVKILDNDRNKILDLEIVKPENADITLNKVSFLAPIGVALLGSKEGDKVKWKMPSGDKTFTVIEVSNH